MKYLLAIVIISIMSCKTTEQQMPVGYIPEENHKCSDSTHSTCDGWCICDGVDCVKTK